MKIIKVYELLGLVNNGEAPKKIRFNDKIWRLASDGTYFIGSDYGYDFWVEHGNDKLENEFITLNDEVEILEEKKIPEKLGLTAYVDGELGYRWSKSETVIKDKINEIIDYLKGE